MCSFHENIPVFLLGIPLLKNSGEDNDTAQKKQITIDKSKSCSAIKTGNYLQLHFLLRFPWGATWHTVTDYCI
uniref:Uncharacterized protein n=1 Tax=Anguilla anguilla TaxID=7936 RepID=A0A0E9WL78_ANGAN